MMKKVNTLIQSGSKKSILLILFTWSLINTINGNGFEITATNDLPSDLITCPEEFNISPYGKVPPCGGTVTVPIPPPDILGSVADDLGVTYWLEVSVDGISVGLFSTIVLPDVALGIGHHVIEYTLLFDTDENGNPVDGLIVKEYTECSFIITGDAEFICNNHVNISLKDDCIGTITPDDLIIRDENTGVAAPFLITINGNSYTSTSATHTFIDLSLTEGTYDYNLKDDCSNTCAGTISVADLQGPTCLESSVEFILCDNIPSPVAPNFLDCNNIAEINHEDLVFGECGNFTLDEVAILMDLGFGNITETNQTLVDLGSILESVTVRSWNAVDAIGNQSEDCLQFFGSVYPISLAEPTKTVFTITCGNGITPKELFKLFKPEEIAPHYSVTLPKKSPLLSEPDTPLTGVILPDQSCGWITNYFDQEIETSDNRRKIVRTWSWLDYCSPIPVLKGPFTQIINVVDITTADNLTTKDLEVNVIESTCSNFGDSPSGGIITAPSATCLTGSTLKYSMDGGNTYSTILPIYDQSTPITVMTVCQCDTDGTTSSIVGSVTTMPEICPTVAPLTVDDLSVTDPCSCSNPDNIVGTTGLGLVELFHDRLEVNTTADVTVTLSATDNNLLDANGNSIPVGTVFTQTTPGVYHLTFYTFPSQAATVTVSNGVSTENFTTASCIQCDATIPTMSQWGLLIFGLLVLNLGLHFIRRKEKVLEF